eukprot:gene8917-10535_t
MIKGLISMGADTQLADKFGKTALIHAANKGYADVVNFLVQCGGEELTHKCKYGFTAKDWADHGGHKRISQDLAKAEADARAGKGPKRLSGGKNVTAHTRRPPSPPFFKPEPAPVKNETVYHEHLNHNRYAPTTTASVQAKQPEPTEQEKKEVAEWAALLQEEPEVVAATVQETETVDIEDGEDENKAATLMQRIARGKVARKEAQAKKEEERKHLEDIRLAEEEYHRKEAARQAEEERQQREAARLAAEEAAEQQRAALQMQRIARGKVARKEVQTKKEEQQRREEAARVAEKERQHREAERQRREEEVRLAQEEEAEQQRAALQMQRIARGKVARKEVQSKKEAQHSQREQARLAEEERERAEQLEKEAHIKAAERQCREEEVRVAQEEEAEQQKAALQMQRTARGKVARKEVQTKKEARQAEEQQRAEEARQAEELEKAEQEKAALQMQRLSRGKQARREVAAEKEEQRQADATAAATALLSAPVVESASQEKVVLSVDTTAQASGSQVNASSSQDDHVSPKRAYLSATAKADRAASLGSINTTIADDVPAPGSVRAKILEMEGRASKSFNIASPTSTAGQVEKTAASTTKSTSVAMEIEAEAPVDATLSAEDAAEERRAATHMQRLARGKVARKEVQLRKEERHRKEEARQAELEAFRLEEARLAEVEGAEQQKAALQMQRIARGKVARKEAQIKKEERHRREAARLAEQEQEQAEQHKAALQMQRIARGKVARKEVQAKRVELENQKKATASESPAPDGHSVTIAEPAVSSVHIITPLSTLDTQDTLDTVISAASEGSTESAETSTGSSTVTIDETAEEGEDEEEANAAALIWAAFQGDLEQVQDLLGKITDINAFDEHGMSALHFAANAGHLEILNLLLAAGADVNAVDENGSTPFHWAAANCHLEVVQALRAAKADINAVDTSGLTALLWAADMGHLEVVDLLLEDGADLHLVDVNGLNALLWAADRGHLDCVQSLLKTDIDVNIADKNGYTAVHRAANGGFLEVVKLLVAAGADLSLADKNGMTALDWAEESEHADVVEYLTNGIHQTEPAEAAETVEVVLEEMPEVPAEVAEEEKKEGEEEEHVHSKAEEKLMKALLLAAHHGELQKVRDLVHKLVEIDFADEHGMTALHYAANAGHLGVVETLLVAKADVHAIDEHGSTPFHWAATNCHLEVMHALLTAHADINAVDQSGMTALLWAADMGHLEVLNLLVHYGASLEAVDENGLTALLWAADRGHVACVKALLEANIDVNAVDKNSYTALHRSSNAGNLEIVQALVAGKADVLRVDKNGMTALDWAISQEHFLVADFLRKYTLGSSSKDSSNGTPKAALKPEVAPITVVELEDVDMQSVSTTLSNISNVSEVARPTAVSPAARNALQGTSTLESKSSTEFFTTSSGDLHALRKSLEFDPASLHLKDNILCNRYYILPGFPLHVSDTAVLVHAVDFGLKADYEEVYKKFAKRVPVEDKISPRNTKMSASTYKACLESLKEPCAPLVLPSFKKKLTGVNTDELFSKYAQESKSGIYISQEEFVRLCKDLMGDTRKIVIKFMRDEGPFRWEFAIRKMGRLDPECVVGTITAVPEDELFADVQKLILTDPSGTARPMRNYPFALIMPAADRSLDSIIRQERPCTSFSRQIMQQVAAAVQHIHQRGVMHGDLYALNVARLEGRMVLIDMDSAVEFGDVGSITGDKFSSGVLPPEMFATLDQDQLDQLSDYWADERDKKSAVWAKIKPVMLRNGKGIVVRTVRADRPDGSGLPYDLVPASDTIDVWSFGLLFYCMMNPTGNGLFNVTQAGDLVRNEENFYAAANWTDEDLSSAVLHNVPDMLAADLLLKLLRRNPADRLDIVQILAHPFFADPRGKSREGRAAAQHVLKLRERMQALDRQQDCILHNTERVFDVSDPAFLQIKKTDTILMRSVFDSNELIVPTCFILVNKPIVRAEEATGAPGQITTANWLKNLSDLSNTDEDLYLYLLDEFTMQPVLSFAPQKTRSPRSISFTGTPQKAEYPFHIQNPAEFVIAVLPLLLLSMKASALLHGSSSLSTSLGHPPAPLPGNGAVAWAGSLDVLDSLTEFSHLQESAEEATVHLTGRDNSTPEAIKVRAKFVRDTALKELCALFGEHHALYDGLGEPTFCGLRRVVIPGGFVCWTQPESIDNLRSGLSAKTHLQLKETVQA